jgi:hypothetical protein
MRDFAEITIFYACHRNRPYWRIGCVEHLESKLHSEAFRKGELPEN